MYRVWTKDCGGSIASYTILCDWTTYSKCRKTILGRWGHYPPFAFISKAQTVESFIRYNGE